MSDKIIPEDELEDFQLRADEAIDNLFVEDSIFDDKSKEDTPVKETGGFWEHDTDYPKTENQAASKSEDIPFISDISLNDRLERLQEYILSLDWEVTTKNIFKLMNELKIIKKLTSDNHNIKTIIVMAIGVLDYIKEVKTSAKPVALQFIHKASDSLVTLGKDEKLSPKDISVIMMNIMSSYTKLPLDVKKYSKIVIKKKAKQAVIPQQAVNAPPREVPVVESMGENLAVKLLMEKIERIEADFKKIEQEQGNALKSMQESLDAIHERLKILEENTQGKILPENQRGTNSTDDTISMAELSKPFSQPLPFNTVSLLTIDNEKFAVESSLVANTFQISSKKAAKLRAAKTLHISDFVSFWESLSKGMRGELLQFDKQVLKMLPFKNITLKGIMKTVPPTESLTKVVILSKGNYHGVIFITEIKEEMHFEYDSYKNIAGITGIMGSIQINNEDHPIKLIDLVALA